MIYVTPEIIPSVSTPVSVPTGAVGGTGDEPSVRSLSEPPHAVSNPAKARQIKVFFMKIFLKFIMSAKYRKKAKIDIS